MGETLSQETYLPEDQTSVAQVYDFLTAHEDRHGEAPVPRYQLIGATPGDTVEVPPEVHRVLRQVVEALRGGYAVTVAPQSLTLTTQQAADLLGVSRPTFVKLLAEGRIRYEQVGTHRRVKLADVLDYRKRRRVEQYEAILATSTDLDDDEDPQEVLARLKDVRKRIAARRRSDRK